MNNAFWARLHGGATHFPMRLSLSHKGVLLGTVSGLAVVGIAVAASGLFRPGPSMAGGPPQAVLVPPAGTPAKQGYKLFLLNCAHCHGTDAHGDEGPDLHGVTKSDQRIATIIQNGVKGEMPRFGTKLNAAETAALVAFIRTLKNEAGGD